ncbi:MAG: outer membrane beta-barrel protein [Bacteroidota bacterium]
MKRVGNILLAVLLISGIQALGQDEDNKLKVSGSVDTYYKYDFSGQANVPTSFGEDHNSISIGMLDLVFEKSSGKSSFVGEIAFGPRNAGSAGPATVGAVIGEGDNAVELGAFAPRIQNLYVSHALSDKVTITGGYMGTFVGYEIISPTGNFNYSTSYLFTNGPFQNAGVKLDVALTDAVGIMVGVFNPWNVYTADPGIGPSSFGAQLSLSPVDGWDAYINFVTGGESGTEIDLTTTFQLTESLLLGLNAANYSDGADDPSGFTGAAVYLNYGVSDVVGLGARYEYFMASGPGSALGVDGTVNSVTISGNIGGGDLKLIPEIRFDSSSDNIFLDGDQAATNSAAQFLVGAVYAF